MIDFPPPARAILSRKVGALRAAERDLNEAISMAVAASGARVPPGAVFDQDRLGFVDPPSVLDPKGNV